MNFIHDATGSVASFAAYAIAGTGLIIYFFKYVRKVYSFDRKLAVKAHLYLSFLLALMIAVHYFTTNKSNFFVIAAIAGFAAVALAGLLLRVKRVKAGYFKKVVAAKVILLIITASFVLIGHTFFEKEHNGTDIEEHSAITVVLK